MVYVEPAFPRGRKQESGEDVKPRKKFKKNVDYGASTAGDEKSQKPRQKERQQSRLEKLEQDKEDLQQSISANALRFKTAQRGMLLLGCVFKVNKMDLVVSLPGCHSGTVPVTAISGAYNSRLQSLAEKDTADTEERCPGLNELYEVGDLVYVKIKEKYEADNRFGLTLDPKELHSELHAKHLVEGLVISATIEEEEDHGYQMDVGIKKVRAFLPAKNVRKNKTEIGRNLYCSVEKVTHANGSATVILKAFKPNEPRVLNIAEANIDSLMPGSIVTFTVEALLSNGLQGTLFDDTVPAFVNENMLEKPLSTIKNFELFQQVQARILYVMPMSKHVFLTLANYDGNKASVTEPVAIGTIIDAAKVIHKSSYGVWFQVGKKNKGLLPWHILRSKYKQNYDEQIVTAKYQVNSLHKVRIVRFEVFDRTLIVSDDESVMESKYFSVQNLHVGEIYDCRITKVLPEKRGYLVSVDKVRGIVTSHNFKHIKPYAVDQTIKLRLIAIEEDRNMAQFSNHPEYLKKSTKLITTRENIQTGRSYHGTVIVENQKFFVVAFCNRITGVLFKYCRDVPQNQNKVDRLKPGIVERFTIHQQSEDGEKITLSIPIGAGSENLGHIATATVTGVFATGTDVYLVKENETGVVPPEAYSDFPEHGPLYTNVLKEGETLQVVNLHESFYSCRDLLYFRNKPTHTRDVRLGHVLRAYCVELKPREGKISFKLALKDYPRNCVLRVKDFCGEEAPASLAPGHVILVKVVRKIQKDDGPLLLVSAKLGDVCYGGVDESLRYMQSYLTDWNGLLTRFKSRDKPFAQYSVGELVSCIVESFVADSDQMVVRLGEDETAPKGLAQKDPKQEDNYTVGEKLSGRVVWLDIEKQLVHVCVTKKLLKHILDADSMPKELLSAGESRKFVTLFRNRYVAVGCLKKTDCPLVVVPVKCHYNDFDPIDVGSSANVVLVRMFDNFVYAIADETAERLKNLKPTPKKEKPDKDCWLPDDYQEPIKDDKATDESDDAEDDSGINEDDGTEEPPAPEIKTSKKAAKKLAKANAVASPAKALKASKKRKKALAKKLKGVKPFTISQLDGADDTAAPRSAKKSNKKKHFLSKRPAVSATTTVPSEQGNKPSVSGKRSGSQKPANLEKKDKIHQVVQQTKFKRKKSKKRANSDTIESVQKAVETVQPQEPPTTSQKPTSKKLTLPGAASFWAANASLPKPESSDSSDDDEQQQSQLPTRKRLTAKERFEVLKQEEKRIRTIEDELADASVDPHTPDQFDRVVLAQPNSSLLWIRYMVFYMESAEIDKARAVARRALKAINFREETERLNVWIALLNLELRYESVDTFKEVLQEAIQYNDPYKVYSKVIEILIDCGKIPEVLDMIDVLQKRFRKEPDMWLLVASCYYKIDHRSKVKPLLSKALKSLENKQHIPLIVKFAFLHNRNGERDEAHILFEQILTSYPKRTDIWSQYVDMLVKDGLVDVARQTLDRAVVQRLPLRNMKTLYTKYVSFEETHGDREAVKRIKAMAADYVQRQVGAGKD